MTKYGVAGSIFCSCHFLATFCSQWPQRLGCRHLLRSSKQTRTNQTTRLSIQIKKIKKPRIYHTLQEVQTLLGPMCQKAQQVCLALKSSRASEHVAQCTHHFLKHVHTEIQGIFCAALCKFLGSAWSTKPKVLSRDYPKAIRKFWALCAQEQCHKYVKVFYIDLLA